MIKFFNRMIEASLGLFFLSCILGGATALRNFSLVLLLLFFFPAVSRLVVFDRRVKIISIFSFLFVLANLPGAWAVGNFADFWGLSKDYSIALFLLLLGYGMAADNRLWSSVVRLQAVAVFVLALLSLGVPWINEMPQPLTKWLGHWYPWFGIASSVAVLVIPLLVFFRDYQFRQENKLALVSLAVGIVVIIACAKNKMAIFVFTCLIIYFIIVFLGIKYKALGAIILLLAIMLPLSAYKAHSRYVTDHPGAFERMTAIEIFKEITVKDPRISGWSFWVQKAENEMPWHGFGQGKQHMSRIVSEDEKLDTRLWDPAMVSHAHNFLFNIYLRSGHIGFAVFFTFWMYLISIFYCRAKVAEQERLPLFAGSALLLSMLIKNLTDDFFEPPIMFMFFYWIGAYYSRCVVSNQKSSIRVR